MTKATTKHQNKCTDRMILPSSSQQYPQTYFKAMQESRNKLTKRLVSSSFSLTSIADRLKQLLRYFTHRTTEQHCFHHIY